jgi:hypothetical protein
MNGLPGGSVAVVYPENREVIRMLLQLWVTLQFLFLLASISTGPHLPDSLIPAILLFLLGTAALIPLAPGLARVLARVLTLAPHAPPAQRPFLEARHFVLPCAPGTSGTVLVRAPSLSARAFA